MTVDQLLSQVGEMKSTKIIDITGKEAREISKGHVNSSMSEASPMLDKDVSRATTMQEKSLPSTKISGFSNSTIHPALRIVECKKRATALCLTERPFSQLIEKPAEGAMAGFFKGVGKGLVGFVAKPIVGVFNLASNVSEGIRNSTTVFDEMEVERTRLPRHIPHDDILRVIALRVGKFIGSREALGQFMLRWLIKVVMRMMQRIRT